MHEAWRRTVDRERGVRPDKRGPFGPASHPLPGKGTLLQFDYDYPPRPPRPPRPNQLWHLGKSVFNKTYWHTVPRGRV